MSCNPNVSKIITPEQIDVRGFSVSGAVRVTAFGLTDSDTVTFQRVQYCSEQPNFQRLGCSLFSPSDMQIGSAVDYQIGECRPSLTAKRNTLIIPYGGSYIPVKNGTGSADLVVEVEPIDGTQFDDKEKGIEPCGLACKDDEWSTTGNQRCNQHFVEQEEISNCGNTRWVRTTKRCGYSASIPLTVDLDDGDCVTAYLFHPNETRDPDATVAIYACNELVGYVYPNAGDGHTVLLEDCEGNIEGWAVNNSDTAPRQTGCNQGEK